MKILAVDFDGVIHSYLSGWKGPRNIPDPPVDGALEFLMGAVDRFEVHIFSSRSRYFGGRRAIKIWLFTHYRDLAMSGDLPEWLFAFLTRDNPIEPWDTLVWEELHRFMKRLKFPTRKPPAHVLLDDRALTFHGYFPDFSQIDAFKPWNRRP